MRLLSPKLIISICRFLPPPLSFRFEFKCLSKMIQPDWKFDEKVLFGNSRISSSFVDYNDRVLALDWSTSLVGMVVARRVLRDGDLVFELGANVGTETLALSGLVGEKGKVVALEPDPKNHRLIRERINCNDINNIILLQKAVYERTAKLKFSPASEENSGIGKISTIHAFDENDFLVDAVTLDELVTHYGSPEFIFMDIEGAEFACLCGGEKLLRDKRPIIFSELSECLLVKQGASCQVLWDKMETLEYSIYDASRPTLPIVTNDLFTENTHIDVIMIPQEKTRLMKSFRRTVLRSR